MIFLIYSSDVIVSQFFKKTTFSKGRNTRQLSSAFSSNPDTGGHVQSGAGPHTHGSHWTGHEQRPDHPVGPAWTGRGVWSHWITRRVFQENRDFQQGRQHPGTSASWTPVDRTCQPERKPQSSRRPHTEEEQALPTLWSLLFWKVGRVHPQAKSLLHVSERSFLRNTEGFWAGEVP